MSASTTMSSARLFSAYLSDIRFEFKKMLRTPAFAVPTLVFPAMFYLLFGVLMGGKGDPTIGLQTFARLGVFGTMAPGLFGFGVSLAFERESGQLTFKQALPMPHGSYLLARMVMAMLFATIISLLLITIALTAAHAPLTAGQAAQVFLIEVLGVLPFCAIGLMVGSFVSGQAAPAIVNLIYLPMALLSGLWVPLQFLPKIIQDTAPLWPSFHLSQLALGALGAGSVGSPANHVAALLGVTFLCFTIAMRRLSNGGVRLLGAPRPGIAFPLRRATTVAAVWISIGLIIAGVMGGKAKVAAASGTATTSAGTTDTKSGSAATDAASSGGPVGVAAPANPLISDFEAGAPDALYGVGWLAAGDDMRGGNSKASQRVTDSGAASSRGALEVSGTIGDGIQYPFAGTAFFPNGTEEGKLMNFAGRRELTFYARGDGRQYIVVFLGATPGGIPPMYGFSTTAEWQQVRIPLADVLGLDLARVHGIVIGNNGPLGDFRVELDDVQLR
jgi:ABC-2 type transport system permease protein